MKTTKAMHPEEELKQFIVAKNHPCIMAQTVFKMREVTVKEYDDFGSLATAKKIVSDLATYLNGYDFSAPSFETFIAVFPAQQIDNEDEFEQKLWRQLASIHEVDPKPWDPSVSSDPNDKDFSFSILGHAFYIVGLHPQSSRKARQAPYPTLVFNLHHQFEKLREMGTYNRVRNRIRARDKKLQGSINPALADFGKASEARQYSGRDVDANWKCPFHP